MRRSSAVLLSMIGFALVGSGCFLFVRPVQPGGSNGNEQPVPSDGSTETPVTIIPFVPGTPGFPDISDVFPDFTPEQVDGANVSIRVCPDTQLAARVDIVFFLGDELVRVATLQVRAGTPKKTVGPEMATRVEVSGVLADGRTFGPRVFLINVDFDENGGLLEFEITPETGETCPDGSSPPCPICADGSLPPCDDNPPVLCPDGSLPPCEEPPVLCADGSLPPCLCADGLPEPCGDRCEDGTLPPCICPDGLPEPCDDRCDDGSMPPCAGDFEEEEDDFADCNLNGVDDALDIFNEFSLDLNGNGVPDECDDDGGFIFPTGCFAIHVDEPVGENLPGEGAGVIDVPGGFDCYTFDAAPNANVFFGVDSVFAQREIITQCFVNTNIQWECLDATGAAVFTRRNMTMFPQVGARTLEFQSPYTISVFTNPGVTGTFAFEVSSLVEETLEFVINVGESANEVIGSLLGLHRYTLIPTMTQQVYFDETQNNFALEWELIRNPGSEQTLMFQQTFDGADPGFINLQAGTEYLINVHPRSGFGPDDLGNGQYGFALVLPSGAEPFGLNVDEKVEVGMVGGTPILGAGQLDGPAEIDTYNLDIASTSDVYFDAQFAANNDFSGTIRWSCPDCGFSNVQLRQDFDPGRFTLDPGTYPITVFHSNGGTATYGFEVLTDPAPADVFPINIGEPVNLGTINGVPVVGAGELESPVAVDVYPFTVGGQGATVYFDVLNQSDFANQWTCESVPPGVTVFALQTMNSTQDPRGPAGVPGDFGHFALGAGDYEITVTRSPFVTSSGWYGFQIVTPPNIPAPQCPGDAECIMTDVVVSGSLGQPGEVDVFQFERIDPMQESGTAPAYFDAQSGFNLFWMVRDVNGGGTVLPSTLFDPFSDPGTIDVPVNTPLEVLLYNTTGQFSNYQFEITIPETESFVIPVLPNTVSDGTIGGAMFDGAGNLERAGSVDTYDISPTTGQFVYFDALGASNNNLQWALRENGEALVFTDFLTTIHEPGLFQLNSDGDSTYQIVVSNPNGDGSGGTYNFSLHTPVIQTFMVNVDDVIQPDGVPGLGLLDASAVATDILTFNVPPELAFQSIFFDVQGDFNNNLRWRLLDPNGNERFSLRTFSDLFASFGQSGIHTIELFNFSPMPFTEETYGFEMVPNPPFNDVCSNRFCAGDGTTFFDNSFATNDGPVECPVDNDVWFEYVTTCTGELVIDTCTSTLFDSQIAVYAGCEVCPTTEVALACNNDSIDCGMDTMTSSVNFPVTEAECYIIRVGGFGDDAGTGNLRINCIDPND